MYLFISKKKIFSRLTYSMFADGSIDLCFIGKGFMIETLQYHHAAKEETGEWHKTSAAKLIRKFGSEESEGKKTMLQIYLTHAMLGILF